MRSRDKKKRGNHTVGIQTQNLIFALLDNVINDAFIAIPCHLTEMQRNIHHKRQGE